MRCCMKIIRTKKDISFISDRSKITLLRPTDKTNLSYENNPNGSRRKAICEMFALIRKQSKPRSYRWELSTKTKKPSYVEVSPRKVKRSIDKQVPCNPFDDQWQRLTLEQKILSMLNEGIRHVEIVKRLGIKEFQPFKQFGCDH